MRNGLAFWISRTSATSSSVRAMSGLSMSGPSAKDGEAGCSVQSPVEGQSLLASGAAVLLSDQIVRKIGGSLTKLFQGADREVAILDLQEPEAQQRRENGADFSTA